MRRRRDSELVPTTQGMEAGPAVSGLCEEPTDRELCRSPGTTGPGLPRKPPPGGAGKGTGPRGPMGARETGERPTDAGGRRSPGRRPGLEARLLWELDSMAGPCLLWADPQGPCCGPVGVGGSWLRGLQPAPDPREPCGAGAEHHTCRKAQTETKQTPGRRHTRADTCPRPAPSPISVSQGPV